MVSSMSIGTRPAMLTGGNKALIGVYQFKTKITEQNTNNSESVCLSLSVCLSVSVSLSVSFCLSPSLSPT